MSRNKPKHAIYKMKEMYLQMYFAFNIIIRRFKIINILKNVY